MATCFDCGKKIGFFNTSNVVDGNMICEDCEDKRSAKIAEERRKNCPDCPNCNTKMIEEEIEDEYSTLELLFIGGRGITWRPGYRCPQCGKCFVPSYITDGGLVSGEYDDKKKTEIEREGFYKKQDFTTEATMEFNRDELKKAYKISVVIGILSIAVNFVFAVCVEILIKLNSPVLSDFSKKEVNIVFTIFVVISIGTFFLIPFMRKQLLSSKSKTGNQSPLPFSQCVQKLLGASVVIHALCSSFCIYGFLMFILTWNNIYYYTFMMMSLISFGMFFQRRDQWEEWMQNTEQGYS